MTQRSHRWWEIHHLMEHMPLEHALRWCQSELCACLGCANQSGGLAQAGVSREEWYDYMVERLRQFAAGDA